MKKIVAGICIAFLLAGLTGCKEKAGEAKEEIVRPIRSMVIQEPDALEKGSIAGRARASQTVELSFRVGGPLVDRPVYVGDVVEEGALVARIDPTDYQSGVNRAQGVFDQARAALKRAEGDYRREMNIFKEDPGATSEAAIDRRREALSSAQANVKSAQAALRSAENQLSYTYLKSPITGKVVNTYAENFETVQPKQRIVRILDNRHIKFDVDVPEQSISYLYSIQDLSVEFDAFPGVIVPATIAEVATEASQTTRTYRVTLLLEQPESIEILAGMVGKARATFDRGVLQQKDATRVPNSAVFSSAAGEKSFVWVVDPQSMVVSKREVIISGVSEFGTQITSGIQAGEIIAIAGVHFLTDGAKVRLLTPEQEKL